MTEQELRDYMLSRIGKFAEILNWDSTPEGALKEPAQDAVRMLGFTSPEEVPPEDVQGLRTVAGFYAWRAVVDNVGAFYTFAADGASYNRSDLAKHARDSYDRASDDVQQAGIGGTGEILLIPYSFDDIDFQDW